MLGFIQLPRVTIVDYYSTVDRSIVRCSGTQKILAICSTALIFLLLFPSREKEVKLIEALFAVAEPRKF
jgi:hypothetical protein